MTKPTREHLAGHSSAYDFLSSHLRYDPDTGLIFFRCRKVGLIGFSDPAGTLNTSPTNGKTYIEIKICGQTIPAHRIAWTLYYGEPPLMLVDHRNGDGTDNRIINLRSASLFENAKNMRLRIDNKLGITGVYLINNGTYRASIKCELKQIHLGRFHDLFSAACARKSAEIKYGFYEEHGKERAL